tara:strand:+ start:1065 stop:1679 length:615 start_codon:yes stop_codon:yes gene_type:complete
MEFFTHVQKVYNENNHQTLTLDIPLAIFMIKLLSIKVDFGHFRDKFNFDKYMISDKPIKLRYYLQIKFRDEMKKATEVALEEMKRENKYVSECFHENIRYEDEYPIYNTPIYEKRIELYNKYLKDKKFDDFTDDKIYIWIQPVMMLNDLNLQIKNLIDMEINKKYGNPTQINNFFINFMNMFSDRDSVNKLLLSMRDIYILGLL